LRTVRLSIVLFLDMLLAEHQLALLLSVPNVSTSKSIKATVDAAVSVLMFGCSNRA
jgi:hypothetical protein